MGVDERVPVSRVKPEEPCDDEHASVSLECCSDRSDRRERSVREVRRRSWYGLIGRALPTLTNIAAASAARYWRTPRPLKPPIRAGAWRHHELARTARATVRSRCANLGTVRWIVVSVAVSLVLTALLSIGLRAFPDAGRRVARGLAELTSRDYDGGHERDRRLRVFVPWKGDDRRLRDPDHRRQSRAPSHLSRPRPARVGDHHRRTAGVIRRIGVKGRSVRRWR